VAVRTEVLPGTLFVLFSLPFTSYIQFLRISFAFHALSILGSKAPTGKSVTYVGPLPLGSWLILFNCFIYGFTFRLDRSAVQAGGKSVYYM